MKVGLLGEKVRLHKWRNLKRVKWSTNNAGLVKNHPLAWYKVCVYTCRILKFYLYVCVCVCDILYVNCFICRRCLMSRVEMGRWGLTWRVWVKEKCGWMVKALVVIGFPFSHLLDILHNLCKCHTCPLTTHYEQWQ